MKKGILMQPRLSTRKGAMRVTYDTNPYVYAKGPIRCMQRYAVIALTTKGSDALKPSFGTRLVELPLMNMYNEVEMQLFIKDQVKDASKQFFLLQDSELNSAVDVVTSIELESVYISEQNTIVIKIRFYPLTSDAVTLSLEV
ncbi:MAG: hypothetical protein PHY48_15310 [Candidatus Cloacimonetes bacterium]|nr:hypothetical protein [Candidatus Cloacimonadota bacterium]